MDDCSITLIIGIHASPPRPRCHTHLHAYENLYTDTHYSSPHRYNLPLHDGNGGRVAQTINDVTTYFVGAHYQVENGVVTKYYFAGAQRVAMRKYTIPQPMTVEYFLGDHLGSTSITTDNTGAKVSEMRYCEASLWDKPWGEVRSWWTDELLATTPDYKLPDYTFTGQYSDSYINLLWYGSRHYDFYQPALVFV